MRAINTDTGGVKVVAGAVIRTEAAVILPVMLDGIQLAANIIIERDPFTSGIPISDDELTSIAAQVACALSFVKRIDVGGDQ